MHLTLAEEALLCNFEEQLDLTDLSEHVKNIWNGEWYDLVESSLVKFIPKETDIDIEEIVEKCANSCDDVEIFCMGIACFLTFMQANFTGPPLSENFVSLLKKHQIKNVEKLLVVDTEEINPNAQFLELFILSKYLFKYCVLKNNYVTEWWSLRNLAVHQMLLDDITPTLLSRAELHISILSGWAISSDRLKAKLHLEISQIYLMYGKIIDSEMKLKSVRELLGIDLVLSGELGRRTKYQQKDVAQINLVLTLNNEITRPPIKNFVGPEIVKLDDDVRLDTIHFMKEQRLVRVPVTEQALILATVQHMQRSRPKDELLVEESQAYCSNILQQEGPWALTTTNLLLRCRLESNHKRTIERSLMQVESIVAELKKESPNNISRLTSIWSCNFAPRWQIESQMADLMLNLGLVKSSLDIYLKLQLWEEVIVCYTILNLRHKAAEIIKEQLNKRPTIKLWCLLGDATDDVKCYEKAWELSECKSSRAQRHWGQFLFAKKEYAECIPHLEKSLEINSLQSMVLLRLGYAALNVEDWKLAASTYRKYTCLEPNSFEAWNNLAKAYVKLGEKNRAHFALQEALKYSFDNWRVWDNFMVVSADTGHFDDLIRAYHQIVDLKEKHLDIEVLDILTKEILNDKEGKYLNSRLKSKTLELFGRLTSIYPGESKLWELYADLSPTPELQSQRLFRAYRGLVQDDWSKDPIKCKKVLEICKRLGEVSLKADVASLSSARLTLKAASAAAKRHDWDDCKPILKSVENLLEKILSASAQS